MTSEKTKKELKKALEIQVDKKDISDNGYAVCVVETKNGRKRIRINAVQASTLSLSARNELNFICDGVCFDGQRCGCSLVLAAPDSEYVKSYFKSGDHRDGCSNYMETSSRIIRNLVINPDDNTINKIFRDICIPKEKDKKDKGGKKNKENGGDGGEEPSPGKKDPKKKKKKIDKVVKSRPSKIMDFYRVASGMPPYRTIQADKPYTFADLLVNSRTISLYRNNGEKLVKNNKLVLCEPCYNKNFKDEIKENEVNGESEEKYIVMQDPFKDYRYCNYYILVFKDESIFYDMIESIRLMKPKDPDNREEGNLLLVQGMDWSFKGTYQDNYKNIHNIYSCNIVTESQFAVLNKENSREEDDELYRILF